MPRRARPGSVGHRPGPSPEIEFESGVQQQPEGGNEPRWLLAAVAIVGLAALALLLTRSPGEPAPPPEATDTTAPTSVPTTREEGERSDGAVNDGPAGDGPLPGGQISPDQRISRADQDPLVPFWLVELIPEPRDEQRLRTVDLDGSWQAVAEPVFFENTRWPSWPGAPLRPFITTGSSVVFQSRGRIVEADLASGDSTVVAEGTTVIDGAADGEYWTVGPGQTWVARHRIGDPGATERYEFDQIGRPMAAITDGLVLTPRLDQNAGELAVWRPTTGLTPVPTDGLEPLGVAGDLIVLGGDGQLVRYDAATGLRSVAAINPTLDLHLAALSPDGSTIALAQRHSVISLGTLELVEVSTGQPVTTVDRIMDREFLWTSTDTITTVRFDGERYLLIEVDLTGTTRTVATIGYPWVYLAAPT